MDTDTVIEVSDQGSSVRKINKNEVSKTLNSTRNAEYENLIGLISAYKICQSTPIQVAGDDTIEASLKSENTYNRTSSSSTI
jgi:hypothetical protein